MRTNTRTTLFIAILAIIATISLFAPTHAECQTEEVIYNFGGNFGNPVLGVVLGSDGTLYGTAFGGSTGSLVYALTPDSNGNRTELNIFDMPNGEYDFSVCALTFDAAGNLYGTTAYGGSLGGGTVFQLKPGAGGTWTSTILYNFSDKGQDGNNPVSGLVFDAGGNLYGVTEFGGSKACTFGGGCGTVYELTPTASGARNEKILHLFSTKGQDGQNPIGGLAIDSAGNLYGTTVLGGNGFGTAFQLVPQPGGGWKEKIMHRFNNNGKDGLEPVAGLTLDQHGNLFGVTPKGGSYGNLSAGGTAFELIPSANGGWGEKIVHNFGNGRNGGESSLGPFATGFIGQFVRRQRRRALRPGHSL
jgi:uncharacterized repeat protein (TIGR03803 family)